MKYIHYCVMTIMAACLLCSCGQRHAAISLAEDFIDEHALQPQKMSSRHFGKLGETTRLSDSLVSVLQAYHGKFYEENISYPAYSNGEKLYFVRMNFVYDSDTLSQTFYIDEQMAHVVAVKINE